MSDIITKPWTEETVTDLDLAFESGAFKQLTLGDGDKMRETATTISVKFAEDDEEITIYKRSLSWKSKRKRTIRHKLDKSPVPGSTHISAGPVEAPIAVEPDDPNLSPLKVRWPAPLRGGTH